MEQQHPGLYAHTPNDAREWHRLEDHLRGTAERASEFADVFGAGDLGLQLGLLHDAGKAAPAFQDYLRAAHAAARAGQPARRRSVDHKSAGAAIGAKLHPILALPILGHHGGLTDRSQAKQKLQQNQPLRIDLGALPAVSSALASQNSAVPAYLNEPAACEMFVRMLFSALVDADYLDTEAHWYPRRQELRDSPADLGALWQAFQADQARLDCEALDSPINVIRREVYQSCLLAAQQPPGLFRLMVPTGGGKTRSGMAFALRHAVIHGLRRVIVAIPYTSIIDQNAQVYRDILGETNVIEHHSALEFDEQDDADDVIRKLLAAENWDAPIVVTTTVQLFESLFSNRPSRCRKLHNIAGSVLVLDEVQTLPVGLIAPVLDVLKELVSHYGVTVVLSTATQPAFSGESPYLKGFDPEPVEIVADPARYFDALRRVEYERIPEPWSWEAVAEEMRQHKQALCVVNSRKDAVKLVSLLRDLNSLHLSTLMCAAHRRDTIAEIRRRLAAEQPCLVVSTQVVEAGVDLDFPVVLRAMGPLDRIVQAAGRCNREGLRGHGTVIIFDPQDGGAPKGVYATAMAEAKVILSAPQCDLHDPLIFDAYYRRLWQSCDLDAYDVQSHRERLDYPEVAERFKMIRENTQAVVVSYGEPGPARLLEDIGRQRSVSRSQWRLLQPYTVGIYRHDFQRYLREGVIHQVAEGLYQWIGTYSRTTGISDEFADPADLVA